MIDTKFIIALQRLKTLALHGDFGRFQRVRVCRRVDMLLMEKMALAKKKMAFQKRYESIPDDSEQNNSEDEI